MKYLAILTSLLASPAHAFVSTAQSVGSDQWKVELKSTFERGKVEPNENRASYQDAQIDIHQVSLAKGISAFDFGKDHFVRIDLRSFKSGAEVVNAQSFYEADNGQQATLTYGFNIVHEPSYTFGIAASISPLTQFNKAKFSVPRIDTWSLGFHSALELSTNWFAETALHYGSGIVGQQNSYFAFTHLYGYRLNAIFGFPFSVKWGPYAELDTTDRYDSQYDAAFSASGRQDRIRSMKIAGATFIEMSFSSKFDLKLGYIQKLGGYDAVATTAATASVGYLF